MPSEPDKAKSRSALVDGCILQSIIMVLAGMILDGGQIFQVCLYAWIAFWGGVFVNVARFGDQAGKSKTDVFLMRYGHFLLCVLSYFITSLIWKWRGYNYLFGG